MKLLKLYDTLREKRHGVSVVNVVGETCQRFVNVPPRCSSRFKGTTPDSMPQLQPDPYWEERKVK